MGIIEGVILIVVLFSLSVFVHELGHFMVARWCGLQIDAFSIGFGPALYKKEINGVMWKISLLPLGGYVALPQMDPTGGEIAAQQGRDLPKVKPPHKIYVALAGAVMNILFAFGLSVAVWIIGRPAQPAELYSTIGHVDQGSEAYAKGLRAGDTVLEVGNARSARKVTNWNDVQMEASLQPEEVLLVVDREGETKEFTLGLDDSIWGINTIKGVEGLSYCRILEVMPDMPALEAGLESEDLITEINGEKLYSFSQLKSVVQNSKDIPVHLKVKRDGEILSFTMTPREVTETYERRIPRPGVLGRIQDMFNPQTEEYTHTDIYIGIKWDNIGYDLENLVHPTPMEQMTYFSTTIFRMLQALTTPSQAGQAAAGLSGPVGIFVMFWIFKASIGLAFWFTALLNVNLAIITLIPFPVLDGGHIMFALWELITRKPASTRFVVGVTQIFVVLIISAFLLLTLRDVDRFILGGPVPPPTESIEAEPTPTP